MKTGSRGISVQETKVCTQTTALRKGGAFSARMASPWEGSGFPGVRGWSAGERGTEERLAPLNPAAFAREEHLQRREDQALPAV